MRATLFQSVARHEPPQVVRHTSSAKNTAPAKRTCGLVWNKNPVASPARNGRSVSSAHKRKMASKSTATTCAENQTVPCSAVKKYTVPKAKIAASDRLATSEHELSPIRRSFSSTKNSTAGPAPASQSQIWPSRKFSGLPASLTKGSKITAGKGGKLMNQRPLYSAKSLFWV